MPFSLSDEQLALTEQALNATLPYEYRAAMKADNGGEVSTDAVSYTHLTLPTTPYV